MTAPDHMSETFKNCLHETGHPHIAPSGKPPAVQSPEALDAAKHVADQANVANSRFIAAASHGLRAGVSAHRQMRSDWFDGA